MHRTSAVLAMLASGTLLAACTSGASTTTTARSAASGSTGASTHARSIPPTATADLASFCTLITKNNAILTDIAAGDSAQNGVDATKLLHDLDAAAAAAPADVKDDLQAVVAFDRQIITTHTDIKETPQLDAALQHYATWVGSHCVGGHS